MTKQQFIDKAKSLNYSDRWIDKAIQQLEEINKKYNFNYSYEDIVLSQQKNATANTSKFMWTSRDVVVLKPKKKQ